MENKTWDSLLEFEMRDLVERHYFTKHQRSANANKIKQITSNFIQGRDYFESAKSASITVKPLLLYYGVAAISRGLILVLNQNKNESQMSPSHGLAVKNWSSVLSSKDFHNIEIEFCDGTFLELIQEIENTSYLRYNSSGVNYKYHFGKIASKQSISFIDIANSLPDLFNAYKLWIDDDLIRLPLSEIKSHNGKVAFKITGKTAFEDKYVDACFPTDKCKNRELFFLNANERNVIFEQAWIPNLAQRYEGMLDIGEIFVVPTAASGIQLCEMAKLYISSYVLGMLARYFPTTWLSLRSGEKGDKVYLYLKKLLHMIEYNYPRLITDFLQSPHEFESKAKDIQH